VAKAPTIWSSIALPSFWSGMVSWFTRFYDFFERAGRTTIKRMPGFSTMISNEVTEFSGTMRWLVCVLAMLNEVPTRSDTSRSHTMRWGWSNAARHSTTD
jgi:hypothetical protein